MKRLLVSVVLALACAGTAQAASTSVLREHVVYMQQVMGMRVTTAVYPGQAGWVQLHPRNILQEQRMWRWRARVVGYRFSHPPHKAQWQCIHRYEGSWRDPNPPYFGGLQMDYGFMSRYGGFLLARKGTADHWTPLEQMWAAERAHVTRGFYPWPNTARYCGLL